MSNEDFMLLGEIAVLDMGDDDAGEYIGPPCERFPDGSPLAGPGGSLAQYHIWLRRQWRDGGPAKDELLRLADVYRQTGALRLVCSCAPRLCHGHWLAWAIRELAGEIAASLTAPARLLVTGSREATPDMLAYTRRVVERAKARGWSVVVGDVEGVDAAVIVVCDELAVPIEVHGAQGTLRHRTQTGENIIHPFGDPERDRAIAERADVCVAVWHERSNEIRPAYEHARQLGIETHIRTFS
jgi:hypothetical protein